MVEDWDKMQCSVGFQTVSGRPSYPENALQSFDSTYSCFLPVWSIRRFNFYGRKLKTPLAILTEGGERVCCSEGQGAWVNEMGVIGA